jgi:signal peptidase II
MARASSSSSAGWLPWLGLALIVMIADQFTKVLILGYYRLGDATYVTSFFNVVRAHNTGAAFSFLAAASGWQRWLFTAIGLAAALFIVWMLRSHAGQKLFSFALACILGGAVGNVVDRLLHGYVVDFLDFHLGNWHFPAFNLADSAITLGAICLILDELLRVRRGR